MTILHTDGALTSVNDDVAICIMDVPPSHDMHSDLEAMCSWSHGRYASYPHLRPLFLSELKFYLESSGLFGPRSSHAYTGRLLA